MRSSPLGKSSAGAFGGQGGLADYATKVLGFGCLASLFSACEIRHLTNSPIGY